MYRIGVTAEFSAAHFLRGYGGSCESVHGHNYRVEAVAEAEDLDAAGLGIDFRVLRGMLEEAAGELDHRLLNDLPPFREANPSAELIARHLFGRLADGVAGKGATLVEVTVWETEGSRASWRPATGRRD